MIRDDIIPLAVAKGRCAMCSFILVTTSVPGHTAHQLQFAVQLFLVSSEMRWPSAQSTRARFYHVPIQSFLQPEAAPLLLSVLVHSHQYRPTTLYLPAYPLMGIRVVSTFWLAGIRLPRTTQVLYGRVFILCGYVVSLHLAFERSPDRCPERLHQFVTLPAVQARLGFATSSPTFVMIGLSDSSCPGKCEVASHCGFDSHFP